MYAILCRNNCQARNPNRRANRQGGRSCSGTTGGIWSANCAPPAPAPGPSCGCPSAWRDSPLARICWASPASCAPWAWSRPATTGSWTSSIARPWIWTNSPAPGALWSSGSAPASYASTSSPKPEYIFGHSCQAVAVLTRALSSVFALPLACRIHEGTVFSNRDHRTLLDKMILLLDSLDLKEPFYFVADAYYAS